MTQPKQAQAVDWAELRRFLQALDPGRTDPVLLALFPPKKQQGSPCIHLPLPADRAAERELEAQLQKRPEHSLGLIPNRPRPIPEDWGQKPEHRTRSGRLKAYGTRNDHIKSCVGLFSEADGGLPREAQERLPMLAGLPEPTLTVWTGGKSLHMYWLVHQSEALAPERFKELQKRLAERLHAIAPDAEIDKSLSNPARVMRLPGGWHPTGQQQCRIHGGSGEFFSVKALEEMLPATASNGSAPTAPAAREGIALPDGHRDQPLSSSEAVALLQHIKPRDKYDPWLRVGMALHSIDPGLLTAWMEWSKGCASFDEAECLAKWESFKGGGVTAGTLYHFAREDGWEPPKRSRNRRNPEQPAAGPEPSDDKPAASFDGMILRLPDGWVYSEKGPPTKSRLSHGALAAKLPAALLRFNEVDMLPEVRTTSGWRSITESDQSDACVHLDQKGWIIGLDSLQMAVLHTARQQPFHPVQDYLLSIEQNPAIEAVDLDSVAPTFLRAQQPLHVAMLRKWLIGAVARALEPGCQMDYCLVTKGLQGIRKSTFFKTLASPAFHCSSVPEHELRFLLNVHSCWLFEFAELESVTSRKEVGRLKNLITTATDWIVPPYGRARQRMARASVFCGTVNEAEFLRDATGDRRFWVVPIEGAETIDTDALAAARDGIWKAAIAAWRAGEKPILSAEHAAESEEQNARFRIEDAWDVPIEDFLRLRQEAELLPVTIPDIFDALDIPKGQQTPVATARVRAITTRLGWEKGRRRHKGEPPKQGLWPPCAKGGCTGVHSSEANQDAGSQRSATASRAQGGARANASENAGSQQPCTPCTPFSPKGVTSWEKDAQDSSAARNSTGVLPDLGCTGCTEPESPSAAAEEAVHRGGAQTRARVHGSPPPEPIRIELLRLRLADPSAAAFSLSLSLEAAGLGRHQGRQVKQWLAWIDANPADPAEVHGWDLGEFDDPDEAAA